MGEHSFAVSQSVERAGNKSMAAPVLQTKVWPTGGASDLKGGKDTQPTIKYTGEGSKNRQRFAAMK